MGAPSFAYVAKGGYRTAKQWIVLARWTQTSR